MKYKFILFSPWLLKSPVSGFSSTLWVRAEGLGRTHGAAGCGRNGGGTLKNQTLNPS